MKAVKFEISTALLAKTLHLPNTARIVAMNGEKAYQGRILLIVESEELPEVEGADMIPEISPTITIVNKQKVFNWNLSN